MATKRKRRKSRRAKRGIYISTKTGQVCKYRSGWEKLYLEHLDSNPLVETFIYEPFAIPYLSNLRTGKMRKYYPDLYVQMIDGSKGIIEIKPSAKIKKIAVVKKTLAAQNWCSKHDMQFSFITEIDLKCLGLMN